jgi:hypothetical protein
MTVAYSQNKTRETKSKRTTLIEKERIERRLAEKEIEREKEKGATKREG